MTSLIAEGDYQGPFDANSSTTQLPSYDLDDSFGDEDMEVDEEETQKTAKPQPASTDPSTSSTPPNRGRRTSVSAESMKPNQDEVYVPKRYEKTAEQKKRISLATQHNFLFKHLDEEQRQDVVDAMLEKKIDPNTVVISQGDVGDYFYIVETGSLDVFVKKNGVDIKVTDYSAGGSFGELALMYNSPRAATVKSTSACVLWALDRLTFRHILMDHTSRKRRMYESFLEEVKLLADLEPYERHKIADALESVTFQDGEVVIKQGDVGENFFIIESGKAKVFKVDEHGVEYQMKGLGKGDYFGELALLNDKPRLATIVAEGKLKCATLGKRAFTRLLGPLVDIMQRNTQHYEKYPGEENE
ncbi:hypothetical protein HMI54_013022 [Coelomomyces lativittatus]|nr:hypothetical protein HMI56_000359 [Coelomomyces lativittatus]KAJ1515017.1 hypothetical protein HMI54_013022 [Coelomomyces lativittatus]